MSYIATDVRTWTGILLAINGPREDYRKQHLSIAASINGPFFSSPDECAIDVELTDGRCSLHLSREVPDIN